MALPQSAVEHYQQQQAISIATAERVGALWRRMGDDFDLTWSYISDEVFATAAAGQLAAANSGLAYVPAVLAEQGIDAPAAAEVNPQRFMGGMSDGRPLESLLQGAVYESKARVGTGLAPRAALALGGAWLQDAVLDAVRDANRQAVASGYTARPKVTGWVRMLNPPSCKFCITLAGKFFRWNQGFQSHRRCDCRHIPTTEAVAGDLTVDPYAYFRSLNEKQQDRLFGKADALAIREGGDIYRVVNIRSRGLADDVLKTTAGRNRGWQARRWDTPSKMTIDDVFAAAKNRDDAIRLMEQNGFITGPQTAGGNLKGNSGYGWAGKMGRGGTRKGASLSYREALRTGVRDPLNPATQTAAETRLHRAVLSKRAVDEGRNPFGTSRLTAADRELVERIYRREIERLADAPQQVKDLARRLGIDEATIAGKAAPSAGAAGGGGVPPVKRGPTAGFPDDDRAARQAALGLDFGADQLEPHEIEFLERFTADQRIRWIPRDRATFAPTNDFIWLDEGGIAVELKTTSARYGAIQDRIHTAVRKAAQRGVVKENFVINIGDAVLTSKLRDQLAQFNVRTMTTPIARLWVMSRDGLEEIKLL